MFYPGDPVEQRKKELLKKLAGQKGGSGGGFGVGRQGYGRLPGFFGRGMAFGGGIKPDIMGGPHNFGGGVMGQIPQAPPMGMGASGPIHSLSGDIVSPFTPAQASPFQFQQPNPTFQANTLKALLSGYGSQPQMPPGYGVNYF